jgi:hypothetical protein
MDKDMTLFPSCDELARAVSDGSYDEAIWTVRWRLKAHMMVCWVCRRYIAQIRWINRAAQATLSVRPMDLNPQFKTRLVSRLLS